VAETPAVVARVPKPQERIPERRTTEPPGGPESEHPPGDHGHAGAPRNSRLRRHPFLSGIGATLLLVAVGLGYLYWDYTGHLESNDDAFIAARQFSIATKVSGYVTSVAVTDNQRVNAGDVIAQIDDRDYRISLAQAQAQVAAAQASIQNIDAQIDVQQAQISASQAQLSQAEAALVFAQQQATRYEDLMKTGSGTIQNAQQYSSQLREQQAALASAQASLKVAQRQLESLKAQRDSAVAQARASRPQDRPPKDRHSSVRQDGECRLLKMLRHRGYCHTLFD
jgi:membrane fusion protein (multidrug efflux system)